MAKQSRSVRQSQVASHQGRGASFEQHESYDDSLLPEAAELARLQELDPNIMQWIKDRTEKEQDARLEFNSRKMNLIEGSTRKAYRIDLLTSTYAFLIVVLGMGFSYLLVKEGQILTGSIFAGATILYAASLFLNFRKKHTKDTKGTDK